MPNPTCGLQNEEKDAHLYLWYTKKGNDAQPYLWDTSSIFTGELVQLTLKLTVLLILTLTYKFLIIFVFLILKLL